MLYISMFVIIIIENRTRFLENKRVKKHDVTNFKIVRIIYSYSYYVDKMNRFKYDKTYQIIGKVQNFTKKFII